MSAIYDIVRGGEGWMIKHDGKEEGSYKTAEAAFEAAVAAASNSIRAGLETTIHVAPPH